MSFLNSLVASQPTNNNYIHIVVYNIHGLAHKDLLRAIFIELVTNPEIFYKLDKYEISLLGTSFRRASAP